MNNSLKALGEKQAIHANVTLIATAKKTIEEAEEIIKIQQAIISRAEECLSKIPTATSDGNVYGGVKKFSPNIPTATSNLKNNDNTNGITNKPSTSETVKSYRHNVSPEHRVVKAIGEYLTKFAKNAGDINLLNSMAMIAEDELKLIDGTVVKIGYPSIKANNKEIFTQILKDGKTKAVYFKNGKDFEAYCEEMRKGGFRVAGNKGDKNGRAFRLEMARIFNMIPGKGTQIYNTVIKDILGMEFAGFRDTEGGFREETYDLIFWSCSPISQDNVWYCNVLRTNGAPSFKTQDCNYGFGALFFKDPIDSAFPLEDIFKRS